MALYCLRCPSTASQALVSGHLINPFPALASQGACPPPIPLSLPLTGTQCQGSCPCPHSSFKRFCPQTACVGLSYTHIHGTLGLPNWTWALLLNVYLSHQLGIPQGKFHCGSVWLSVACPVLGKSKRLLICLTNRDKTDPENRSSTQQIVT